MVTKTCAQENQGDVHICLDILDIDSLAVNHVKGYSEDCGFQMSSIICLMSTLFFVSSHLYLCIQSTSLHL